MEGLDQKLNTAAQQVYRTGLHNKLVSLLNDPLFSRTEKQHHLDAMQAADGLALSAYYTARLKELTARRQVAARLTRREREALTPEQIGELAENA